MKLTRLQRLMKNNQGITSVFILILLFIMSGLIGASSQVAINNLKSTQRSYNDILATSAAEAGAERAIAELKAGTITKFVGGCSWCNTNVALTPNPPNGKTYYNVDISAFNPLNPSEIQILSTGKFVTPTGSPGNASDVKVSRKIRVYVVETINSPFPYAVQTGPGGLIMENTATIATGDVQVNGSISMSGNQSIGTILTPSEVWAAHKNCPIAGGPTYPILCTGFPPESISITQPLGHIFGDVHAPDVSASTKLKMSNDGWIDATAPDVNLPPDHRTDITVILPQAPAITAASAQSCPLGEKNLGTPGMMTKITGGNVTIQNCSVTVLGNLWFEGGLHLRSGAVFKPADILATAPYIFLDGQHGSISCGGGGPGNIDVFGLCLSQSATVLANALDAAFQFIAFYCDNDSNATNVSTCSPDSVNLTGNTLFYSKDRHTIVVSNTSAALGSVMYSRWSKVRLKNSGSVGAMIGQTVHLDNSGSVTFGVKLGNNPTGNTYTVTRWQTVKN